VKRALVTALLVCGCQASTPSRDPKPKEANLAMSKPVAGSKTVAAVTCHGRSPAKPPNQTYPCDIEISGAPASAHWLLIPRSLDEPLRESSPIDKLELLQTAAGVVYLGAYGEPGFYALRIDGGHVRAADWKFTTAHDARSGELWLADEVELSSGGTLSDIAAGALAPPGNRPSGAALLASWTPPAGTRAAVRGAERHAFPITPPP
jgi:hypothetical protein